MPGEEVATLTIESVGARGDGIAHWQGEPIYLPFTAPGDRVLAALGARRREGRAARVLEVLAPGARAEPVCPHFGVCGGCALQHLSDDAYREAKESWLRAALVQHGLGEVAFAPLARLPAGTRRRARLTMARPRDATAALIGYQARGAHRIIDMHDCAVLHPDLVSLVGPLRRLACDLWRPGSEGAATLTRVETGIDLLLDLPAPPDLAALEALAGIAEAQDLARLSWRSGKTEPSPVALRRPVRAVFAGVAVDLPADAFLQPSIEADAALSAAVLDLIGDARRIGDLFAGIGTFSFALARRAAVHAVEGSGPAVAALAKAAARAGLADRVTSERRDLETRPLSAEDCARFDAIVFDPPYAGAPAQSRALSRSKVKRIVAVSCNPATFARDARVLVDGGYRLIELRPFDAFIWSPHLEIVARLERQ